MGLTGEKNDYAISKLHRSFLIVFFAVYLYLKTRSTLEIKENAGQEYLSYHAQKS